jgi:stage II sporulation protein D
MINNLNRPFPNVIAAVEATRGQVLKYGGALIQAVYHSKCGGMTAAAGEVWGWDIPYLQSVKHPYCRHSPHYRQEMRMDLAAFLAAIGIGMDERAAVPVLAGREPVMEVLRQGADGRNLLLRLPPRIPERTLNGTELRRLLGLPSTHFQWQVEGDEVVFHTRGFGHGVGLCQYGADGMGQAGHSFAEILKHFYPGALISGHNENY